MKDRIAHIMRAKNLKATDFANLLGIQPSGVSHILAGRNNPSLEFVKKIKETFPEYNLDWIVFGTGPMTTSEPFKETFREVPNEIKNENPEDTSSTGMLPFDFEPPQTEVEVAEKPKIPADSGIDESRIKSVMILYEDGTFETFVQR